MSSGVGPLRRPWARRPALGLACLLALALAGCGSGETIQGVATRAAQRGQPCEASEVEPTVERFARECTAQQEARARQRAIREGEELKAQASRPAPPGSKHAKHAKHAKR